MGTVSIYGQSNFMPQRPDAMRMNEVSKSALWAMSTGFSPQKAKKASSASFSFGAPRTISSVMLVSLVIFGGMGRSGSTKVSNESATAPFRMRTAPISVIRSPVGLRPVVSMSNEMNSSRKDLPVFPFTAGTRSLTK